jgi:hypothetical protein
MKQHILIVTGTRGPPAGAEAIIRVALEDWHRENPAAIHVLEEGGAAGVDEIARHWAHGTLSRSDVRVFWRRHKADWDRFSTIDVRNLAGPVRNEQMVQWALVEKRMVPDTDVSFLAFPGPESRGTWDCVNRCKREGIPVKVVRL